MIILQKITIQVKVCNFTVIYTYLNTFLKASRWSYVEGNVSSYVHQCTNAKLQHNWKPVHIWLV